jgi:prolyl-tRNA synthetase
MMPRADRLSRLLVPTLKEAPAEARGVARALLWRGGFVRRATGGGDVWLAAGQRVRANVVAIARQELAGVDGAQEVHGVALDEVLRRDVRSPKQLPLVLFAVGDDVRVAAAGDVALADAWSRVLARAGVRADALVGGALAVAGEGDDEWLACTGCASQATYDAAPLAAAPPPAAATEPLRELHTPGAGGIADVVRFLGGGFAAAQFVKTLVYVDDDNVPLMALVRGDRAVDERKLSRAAGKRLRLAADVVVREVTGAAVGFAGAQGRRCAIFADPEAAAIASAVTGANKTDYHVIGFNVGRDAPAARIVELRRAVAGDACACGGTWRPARGALVAEPDRLSIDALVVACAAQHHDGDGVVWPKALAPWQVVVVALGAEPEIATAAAELADRLAARGLPTLYDDRDERAGVKFKDADLLGVPTRLTVGKRGLAEGGIERKRRGEKETSMVPKDRVVDEVVAEVRR